MRPSPSNWRRRLRRASLAAVALLVLPAAAWRVLGAVYPLPAEALADPAPSVEVLARDGSPLSSFTNADGNWHVPVPITEISPRFLQAVIAIEDRRFRSHNGVDPLAIARAAVQNATSLRVVSGASTLTMQTVRLAMPHERTLGEKCVEAFRAWQLEERLPKDAILERWANLAPFGGNLVGVEAASRRWFGKHARDLSLAEAALLAGLPQSPSRLRPDRHPDAARARRDRVLARMREQGLIGEAEEAEACAEPVVVRPETRILLAPHLSLAAARLQPRCARVRTTIDPAVQEAAERALAFHLARIDSDGAAAVVLDNATGDVLAYVGSPDFLDERGDGQVDAASSPRSPGSSLKPFLFALAFEDGETAPERLLSDAPLAHSSYRPENCDGGSSGPVTAREALVRSLNLPAVRLLGSVGVDRLVATLCGCGVGTLTDPDRYGLSLVLGGGEVTLIELTEAYSTLARLGVHVPARMTGEGPVNGTRVLDEGACWLLADVLRDARAIEAQGFYADVARPFALKTGTSSGQRDAWAFAYGPRFTVGVWFGHPDGRASTSLRGAAAAPCAAGIYAS
ncbi:MAG: penicillin-binding protein 1C, partial [Planctomycetota bacterium]